MKKNKELEHNLGPGCNPTEPCHFTTDDLGNITCLPGSPADCFAFAAEPLLDLEISLLHDQHLHDAVEEINKVIAGIPAPEAGQVLTFLFTPSVGGIALVWMNHDIEPTSPNGVTGKSSPDEIAKALKIKNWKSKK